MVRVPPARKLPKQIADNATVFEVESASRPNLKHYVFVWNNYKDTGHNKPKLSLPTFICTCPGFQHNRKCWHTDEVIYGKPDNDVPE